MNPNNIPSTTLGGRARAVLPTRRPGLRIMNTLGGSLSTPARVSDVNVAAPVALEMKKKKKIRIYTLKDFADGAAIEAALAGHLAHAQEESPKGFKADGVIFTKGATFIGFTGKESRVLSQEELLYFVLADKSGTIATQLCKGLNVSPIPLTIAINLIPNTKFSTTNTLQAPNTAECKATTKEDLEKIIPFKFQQLPHEVRRLIYLCSNVFALGHDGQLPAFYQVARRNEFLHEEAIKVYKQINYHLTLANEPEFNKLRVHRTKNFNHIYFQWGDLGMPKYQSRYLQLRANRCQLINNFRTITMDYSTTEPCNFSLMQLISRASSGVCRLTVRLMPNAQFEAKRNLLRTNSEDAAYARHCLIHCANEWIRTPGRLVTVSPADVNDEWFWERDDGKFLDLGPVGMVRRKGGPAKGRLSLEDRVDGRSVLCR